MSPSKYTIGVDFGTLSGRALLVRVADGAEIATAVSDYSNAVIDERLPESGVRLEPDWALQDPDDYIRVFAQTIPAVLKQSGVSPDDVIGIGIDFTACTMLPTKRDGTPLCRLPEWRANPHAWVKLWKHHAAQPEADRVNEVAAEMGETWLPRYGGKISSEWFFPKALQILNEAPDVYDAADRMLEAADWVIWQLTGIETRNTCTAGYKALWSKRDGFPRDAYFKELHPHFEHVVDDKMMRDLSPIGARAGSLTPAMAALTGLRAGTAVAVANVDAHVAVPAVGVTQPGSMVSIMGTSVCDMLLGPREKAAEVEGMCGYTEDGILAGFLGYEAGQSCVGDGFAWFVENCVPPQYFDEAKSKGRDIHQVLEAHATALRPGESGLLALDWWNGNRSILVDANLSAVMLGMTLATTAPEMYRAWIEATAFGKRVIIDSFAKGGVLIHEIVACGGLPEKNKLFMQLTSDIVGLPIKVSASAQTPALGSAMFGALVAGKAAGGYDTIEDAAAHMAHLKAEVFTPTAAHKPTYDALYAEYVRLHDLFGRDANSTIKNLKKIRLVTHQSRVTSHESVPKFIMRKIALQLYTVRETIKTNGLLPVLKDVAAMGYTGVEGGSFMGNMPAKDLRKVLDDLGLHFVSGHVNMDEIKAKFDAILDDYVTLGAGYVGLSWIGEEYRKDTAHWQRSASAMNAAAERAQKHGLTFFYHNHDFEFKTFDGKTGFDILFDAADPALVKSELDVYWVKKGGHDPVAIIKKFAGRAPLLHIKDMTADASQTFEIVGDGIIDFDAVMKAGDANGADWYIVEQDLCPKGELFSARKSHANIVARGWQ